VRVLRISHSAAVDEWRGRERSLRGLDVEVNLLSARRSVEGAGTVELRPREDEEVTGVGTLGRHPALFLYDPRPIWRALGGSWDVIDVHEEPFALATAEILFLRSMRRNRAPVVLYTAQNLRKRYPIPFRWLESWALRSAAGISACNSEAARIVVEKGFAGRPRVIPLGIDPGLFTTPVELPRRPVADGEVTVGFLGRLVREKGVGVLLDAAAKEPRLRLRIGGTGPDAQALRAIAHGLGISDRTVFVGPIDPRDVVPFYRSVDVIAVPSLTTSRWIEQFGRVAVEAMACGVPVVSSDAGALPEVVDSAGIVVPEADARALAAAVIEAAGPRREELRALGQARATTCTWDAIADDYLALYRSISRTPPGAESPGVEIVVVAYGAPELLHLALERLSAFPVTVVDNSSRRDIEEMCGELGIRYLDPGRNLGFARGVNIALRDRLSPGADILLLNPDAQIEPSDIAALQRAMRAEIDLATVAPAQVDGQGSTARVEWNFPSPYNAWMEAIGLSRLQRGPRFVIGSVLLMRAEALDQVGFMDERFFLYAEETDWAYRAHRLGWRHAEVKNIVAKHVGAGTSADEAVRNLHFFASQEKYLRKHFGALGWQSARAANWLGAFARSLILRGEKRRIARHRAKLYRAGPMRSESHSRPR
jgi:glycosyltransferase involved in cell wall biosynthesis/GT2 family glycosyltransferase